MTHPPGRIPLPTRPGWQQVLRATSGALTVATPDRSWLLPAGSVLCLGHDRRVEIQTTGRTAVRASSTAASASETAAIAGLVFWQAICGPR